MTQPMHHLLIIGRWHAVTRDQEAQLCRQVQEAAPDKVVLVITAADQAGTKRHPLSVAERREIVQGLARRLGVPFAIFSADDIQDESRWVEHIETATSTGSAGAVRLESGSTTVLSANPYVLDRFEAHGYTVQRLEFSGAMPADVLGAIASGGRWQEIANDDTVRVYQAHDLVRRIRAIFADVLLTEEGELSTDRDFRVYAAGMDASLALKLEDICTHLVPGRIVDKGCGTGKLLVHLSALFPTSQIVGVDLSRELLHTAESQHYVNQNVSIVKANIIHPHFPPGTVSSAIFSSVIHELYSYTGYDRAVVRLALRNTRSELQPGGRAIIRDGVSPGNEPVWLRCDGETEGRFRRFAREFKGKSPAPGMSFEERAIDGQTWFRLRLHDANEFLSKKDYLENWAIEVNEEFGVFTLAEWRRELEQLGYRVIEARSYVNSWILENRYRNRVWLHANGSDRPGAELPFPDTTAVIVGEAV